MGYVRNIYKYYAAYKLQLETLEARKAALRETTGAEIGPTGIMAPIAAPLRARPCFQQRRTVMAGHSKWANIQHRKGRQDEKRGAAFSKIAKEITVAAKMAAATRNPRLRVAIDKGKAVNMPKDKIDTAIKKGTSELEASITSRCATKATASAVPR